MTPYKLKLIAELKAKKKQALKYAARQRRLERDKSYNVKVSSSFWEHVAGDYQRQINSIK